MTAVQPSRPARVAINGLGRIGRQIARLMAAGGHEGLELVAVNTLERVELAAHLLKYDSLYGILPLSVEARERQLVIGGKQVLYFQQEKPDELPWLDLGIDIVIECAGLGDKGRRHLEAGAKRVIVAGTVRQPDITICMGVNHGMFEPEAHHFICGASCTANMVAPAMKVLDDALELRGPWRPLYIRIPASRTCWILGILICAGQDRLFGISSRLPPAPLGIFPTCSLDCPERLTDSPCGCRHRWCIWPTLY